MGLDDEAGDIAAELVSDNTTLLANAVSSLPELLEKKRHLNLHMNMASAVLEEVKRRKLDQFFETEVSASGSCFFFESWPLDSCIEAMIFYSFFFMKSLEMF